MPDAFGAGALGLSGVGLAVLDRPGLLRALRPEQGRRHKTLTEWAWQLLLLVRRWYPEREIVAVADGGYASLKLLDRCRRLTEPITFITRLRLDAALYEEARPRYPGQIGRPRLKGERLANLSAVAEDPATAWKSITVADWYGGGSAPSRWLRPRRSGTPRACRPCPLRWVLIRDPEESSRPRPCCAPNSGDPKKIIGWFVRRWQMEICQLQYTFGRELPYHWSPRAIRAPRVGREARRRPHTRKRGRSGVVHGSSSPPFVAASKPPPQWRELPPANRRRILVSLSHLLEHRLEKPATTPLWREEVPDHDRGQCRF